MPPDSYFDSLYHIYALKTRRMEMKRFQRFFSALLILILVFSLSAASACADSANWYEIFVRSYRDSDGDGIGDLRGVEYELPYIASLGIDGIWLMPIMPSPSYHKYDVTDYYDVDPEYGTLDDLRALLAAAHELGIRVILDLPVNHSSSQHPWFVSALADENSPYRNWYIFTTEPQNGYTGIDGVYYESRFVADMPDLNLDNADVRAEIAEILRFWLTDIGVDGFRLDAVTSYYTGRTKDNVAFLSWLGQTARSFSPDCYIVAEAWDNLSVISSYAEADIDSFFLFPVSQQEGYIAKLLGKAEKSPGKKYTNYTLQIEESLPEKSVPAPFLENHDTARSVNFLGRSNIEKIKMAAGLLCMMRGNVFVYYGQEIGMAGSGDDPNKRIGMLWDQEENAILPPPGTTKAEYVFPGVSEQAGDPDSILSYYREALAIRTAFPQIARGNSRDAGSEDPRVSLLLRGDEQKCVLIASNPSKEEASVPLSGEAASYTAIAAALYASGGEASLSSGTLTLPAYSIAILQQQG